MPSKDLRQQLKENLLFFDGAMGTMLEGRLSKGELTEMLNLSSPELILDIHRQYVDAGADIITANTFGANRLKYGDKTNAVITAGIKIAKQAGAKYVALDIGSLGQILKPLGTLDFEQAVEIFAEQVIEGKKSGADLILIETMSDLYELKAAIIAAKENSDLPIFASLTFEKNLRTFMGCDAKTAVVFLDAIGVDAIGINCSYNPFDIEPIVQTFLNYTSIPILVMPNAGLPNIQFGKVTYSVAPQEFAKALNCYYKMGVRIFGGCCGTTPMHISMVVKTLKDKQPLKTNPQIVSAITSGNKTVEINNISIIGERINPTGKPKLKVAIEQKDFSYIIKEAIAQQDAGADILDINCGLFGIDEGEMLPKIIEELQGVLDIPLQIDSTKVEAIEKSVRIYNGKPLINSANGTIESMQKIFPIAKKYGAAIIALTLDENGIPKKANERFELAKKIVQTADSYGIKREDIIIDCLVLTASAQQEQVFETIDAIRQIKQELKVKTVLGVSNVSFGLPNRVQLNSVFLIAALTAGLDCAIINPLSREMIFAIKAFRVLKAMDKNADDYIKSIDIDNKVNSIELEQESDIKSLIMSGQKQLANAKIKQILKTVNPLEVIETYLMPALEETGKKYESGKIFLPQLIMVAECAKSCFDIIKTQIPKSISVVKEKIILATVKGDVHDIGKNIVKVLLESYGYQVIDLGKDVDEMFVADQAKEHNVKLVGLSALMTTTLPAMKKTIENIKNNLPSCVVMVGGAVLSEDYAKLVGADFFAKDAKDGVEIAQRLLT